MMAVGKTTLGKIVAKKQRFRSLLILIQILKKKISMKISEIFKKKGEKFFRKKKKRIVLKSLKKK